MIQSQEPGLAGLYQRLSAGRAGFLNRARDASTYTIPSLIPPEGANADTKYNTPFEAFGARAVNNLAAKLVFALFPPTRPFFSLRIKPYALAKVLEGMGDTNEAEVALTSALAKIETTVQDQFETDAYRAAITEALRHLVVGGNILLRIDKGRGMRSFPLSSYVVERDSHDTPQTIITKEQVSFDALPPNVREWMLKNTTKAQDGNKEKTVSLYTGATREDGKWSVWQEISGQEVPDTKGSHPDDELPWFPLRWSPVTGEGYGRSLVEEYIGDLASLESLKQSVVQGSLVAAKVVWLVRPNGTTKAKDLSEARSGGFVSGNAEDLSAVQAEKFGDLRVAFETGNAIREELSKAFLMSSSIQRNAERVTAEEIRFMAAELEDALGGVYSMLARELQLPLATILMRRLEKDQALPKVPLELVNLKITTGLEALSRVHDASRLNMALAQASQVLTPQVLAQYLKPGAYLTLALSNMGVDPGPVVKSDEQIAAELQQAQQQQAALELGKAATPAAVKAMAEQGTQQNA